MVDLNIEHILLFLIAIFLLYHLMICGVNYDRFNVGGQIGKIHPNLNYLGKTASDLCTHYDGEWKSACESNFYKNTFGSAGKSGTLQQCLWLGNFGIGNMCVAQDGELCDGSNCPSCDSFIMKNMNLKLNPDGSKITNQPLDCTSIISKDVEECEKTYEKLYETNASNLAWDNGSFIGGGDLEKLYNIGSNHWHSLGNKITDICDSPMQASILRGNIRNRCNDNIETSVEAVKDIDKNIHSKNKDVDIIKQVKDIINDETIDYGSECCGPSKKCSSSELSKLQGNYLEKIAKEIYCEPTTCNRFQTCNGSYNATANNGSGSLGTNCNTCGPEYKLSDNSCGIPTCGHNGGATGTCKFGHSCAPVHMKGGNVMHECD